MQHPHTLFIVCSNSRIDPNLISGSLPGELFVVRNIGNLVPTYKESPQHVATAAAIEYAVVFLKVQRIIVCGHSDCECCMSDSQNLEAELCDLPLTRRWLELRQTLGDHIRNKVLHVNLDERSCLKEQENILQQLDHLMTYPFIKKRVEKGTLQISGWHYRLEANQIYVYNRETDTFELID